MSSNLKPCPWCAAEMRLWSCPGAPFFIEGQHDDKCPLAFWKGAFWPTEAVAIAAWNTREEPPVDPLLIEARKLVADRYPEDEIGARNYTMAGDDDESQAVQNALTALRRGIELAERK